MGMLLGATVYVFAIILAVFLIGLAILIPLYVVFFVIALNMGPVGQFASVIGFVLLALFGQYAVYRARRYRLTRTVYRGVRFVWVHRHAPAEQRFRTQAAQHNVGIRYGRLGAAAPVRGRPRICPSALRPDFQLAVGIGPHD